MIIVLKGLIVGLAFMIAYIVQKGYVRPRILEPACLVDTNSCAEIEYYPRENTVFAIVRPSSYRLWFNGTSFYVYDISNTGRTCSTPGYQPAFEIKPKKTLVQNYICIRSIASVFEYYKNVPKERAFIRMKDPSGFSAFDVIQYFIKQKIIKI